MYRKFDLRGIQPKNSRKDGANPDDICTSSPSLEFDATPPIQLLNTSKTSNVNCSIGLLLSHRCARTISLLRSHHLVVPTAIIMSVGDQFSNREVLRNVNPFSFAKCLTEDGDIDVEKFFERKRHQFNYESDTDYGIDDDKNVGGPKKRAPRIPILARRNENGDLQVIPPTQSMWYVLYVSAPNIPCKRFQCKFRRRFRMPYQSFVELVAYAQAGNWFP